MTINQRIAGLSPEKRAALEAHLLRKRATPHAVDAPHQISSVPELSYAQTSLWFLDRLQPNSSFYNIPQALRIVGPLQISALEKSLATVIQRHEILRTVIVSDDGKPEAKRLESFSIQIPITDLVSEAEQSRHVKTLMEGEAIRPFNLACDLMLRASLIRLRREAHVLLLTLHHIAADLWSFSNLYRELSEAYDAFCHHCAPRLTPLPRQYSDFARNERAFLESTEFTTQLAYWKKQLAGDLPESGLPLDRPRPESQTFRGAQLRAVIPPALAARVRELSQREGVTVYIVLLAAFQTLLHRYSGQSDILVGSPFAGRERAEVQPLIGYFLNMLALRIDLAGDPTFCELLQRSRDVALGAFTHQQIPFEKLVDELNVPRNANRNPIFQSIFQFYPAPLPKLTLAGAQTELLPIHTGTAKVDFTLTVITNGEDLITEAEYCTDLFDAETIERLLAHYVKLLESACVAPEQNISRLNLLDDAERHQLLEWAGAATTFPRDKCIHEIFEAQVRQAPEAVALEFAGTAMTYRELNARANELARYLQICGVVRETRVAVCLDRSLELVVALLAILKAGGAYVPLDASYPEERLAYMLEDAGAALLIANKTLPCASVRTIDPEKIPPQSLENLSNVSSAEDVAYLIYTSGSTGKPKGVAVPHRAVVRLVKETNFAVLDSHETFLLFAPVSFDASTLELWGSLLNGARLVIHPPELPSLEAFGNFLQTNRITTLWLTAGLFHEMVDQQIEGLRGVRQLLAGGDVLSVSHVQKVLAELPECQLINGYGPTENTTFTCCFSVPKSWTGRTVPIGKPISNTQVYVLDKHFAPTPIGVAGELMISGDGLARGYWNAPELDAEKFVPNPFCPGTRLYRTGDRVRFLRDGNLEFLGRMDHQVKIRGFRIEPGEVESVLNQHPLLRQVLVVARGESEKCLVAYFTADVGVAPTPSELRTYLEQSLPGYMVPRHFVLLPEFPLTPNGKIDRRRLPASEVDFETDESTVAPRNKTEEQLLAIWREVLGRNSFGVHQNFFALGGHSLLATRVASRISKNFQIDFSLRTIFERPTVASLAQAIDESAREPVTEPPLLARRHRGFTRTPPKPSRKNAEDLAGTCRSRYANTP